VQVLINLFSDAHGMLGARYRVGPNAGNRSLSVLPLISQLSGLIATLDAALAADQNFLLGTWIADAAQWGGDDPAATALWVFNARNQITLWGPDGEISDYAAKHWAGLVGTYYGQRWALLFAAMRTAVLTGEPYNQAALDAAIFSFEKAWGNRTGERPPAVASGASPVALAAASVAAYTSFDAARWRVIADTAIAVPPRSKQFVQVGGNGQAAVGSDCPFLAHGDGSSLANCEASCLANAQCNAVNWAPAIPDCVFRMCDDPLNPQLSPNGGYTFFGNNETAASPAIFTAWHADQGVLATMCSWDPACAGFSLPAAVLYSDVTATVAQPGAMLYVRV